MTERAVKIDKSWAVAGIATVAFFRPWVMPDQLTLHSSGRLVVWPAFAIYGGLVALWLWAWVASIKTTRVPRPLALVTFLMTAYPLFSVSQQWQCLTGECFWWPAPALHGQPHDRSRPIADVVSPSLFA